MWEAFSNVMTSSNAGLVLAFLIVLVIFGAIFIKSGKFSINTKTFRIGNNEEERTIIRNQVEWVKLYCKGIETRIPHPEGYNKWRGLYVLERIFDEVISWITFNHITTNDDYVEIKQTTIINLVDSLTDKEEFHSEEFREQIRKEIKTIITKLVQIRQLYIKENG